MPGTTTDHPPLRIGELAEVLGLNPKTIRYYEQIGLLPQPQRTRAGYRLYSDADLERLRFIVRAKAVGLSLDEIREVLELRRAGQQPCAHVVALLDEHLAGVEEQLGSLREVQRELIAMRAVAASATPSDDCVCGIIEQHAPQRPLAFAMPVRPAARGR